jgi:hypothetical protein
MGNDPRVPLRVRMFSASLRAESLSTRLARLVSTDPAVDRVGT